MLGANGIDYIEKLIGKGCKQRNFALMPGDFTPTDFERASKLGCVLFFKQLDMHAITAWVEALGQSISSDRVLYNWVAAAQILTATHILSTGMQDP